MVQIGQRALPSPSAVVVATDRHVACDVGGESVILQLDQGMYYGLNPVGALVWRLVQEPQSIAALVEGVAAEFDVDRTRCLSDIRELVDSLQRNQLVSVTEEQIT